MENRQSNPKTAVWGEITPLRANCQNSSYTKLQQRTVIGAFLPEIPADLSRYKEMRVHCTPYKKLPPFSPPFCAPFAQDTTSLTREICVRSTYACKILSGSVKVCESYSRKANFEQIRIMLSCICMTAYHYILHCKRNLAFSAICKVTPSEFTAKLSLFVSFRKLYQTHFCGR